MRVIFLTHNFPRFVGDVSGAFLAVLARGLQRRGVEVRVVAPSDGGDVGASDLEGIPVRRVRYATPGREQLAYRGTMAETGRSLAGARTAAALVRAMRRAAREEVALGADLIHAHWWVPAGMAAPRSVPVVVTIHGTDAAMLERSALARFLARRVLRSATVVTAVSDSAAARISRFTGRQVDAAHIHPMPVETRLFGQKGTGGKGMIVVGRLTAQKRVDLAIRALAALARPGLTLTILGDGPERSRLEGRVTSLGLEGRVRFLGAQPPERVAAELAGADVALFPAAGEGFGLSAAEALMMGVPVVACHDGGGVLSVVPASGAGRRADPSAQSLARAASELLGDPGAREAAWRDGQRWREQLSPEHAAEACEGWYREALGA
ncbi:MAG: glycosyltransferase family 4 protein [Gemmatimonadales bacterium]|nr:MAG: glycosyltransferase family 4 protein [Gemmatimonadales bacterium]